MSPAFHTRDLSTRHVTESTTEGQTPALARQAARVIYAPATMTDEELRVESVGTDTAPVFGCTTAGELAQGYLSRTIVDVPFDPERYTVRAALIEGLRDLAPASAYGIVRELVAQLPSLEGEAPRRTFAVLLIDGLCGREERVTSWVHAALGGIPLIGGSAGDDLQFDRTRVFLNGRVATDAAVLALVSTDLDFEPFQVHHFSPGEAEFVVTEADPSTRTIFELNGDVAAVEYARAAGVPVDDLGPDVFAAFPLLLRVGGDSFVRSIRTAEPDGSLTLYCAIEEGLPLSLGTPGDPVDNLQERLASVFASFEHIEMTLVFDCILRRLALVDSPSLERLDALLSVLKAVGFNSYGEQFNAVHVNQTLTGIVIGKRNP